MGIDEPVAKLIGEIRAAREYQSHARHPGGLEDAGGGAEPAIGPFDDRDPCGLEVFVQARGMNLCASFQPVEVEMKEGKAPAGINVHQGKGKSGDKIIG